MSIFDLFTAGSDTSATTTRWALLYLIHYPDVQAKCQQIIKEVCVQSVAYQSMIMIFLPCLYIQKFLKSCFSLVRNHPPPTHTHIHLNVYVCPHWHKHTFMHTHTHMHMQFYTLIVYIYIQAIGPEKIPDSTDRNKLVYVEATLCEIQRLATIGKFVQLHVTIDVQLLNAQPHL